MPKRQRENAVVSTVTKRMRVVGKPVRRAKKGSYRRATGRTRTSGYYGRFSGPNAELKFFDTTLSIPFDATGEVPATGGQLCLIPQGDTESSRDGRMAYIRSLQLRGAIEFAPGAAATAYTTVHLYLVHDMQTNGAAAAVTDVLTSTSLAVALVNIQNSQRFKILKRWDIPMNPGAGATTALNGVIKPFNYYMRCNIPITYGGATGAITEIKDNNLFLIAGAANSDDLVTLTGKARVRFYD